MSARGIVKKDPANFTPTLGDYKDLQPFRFWCQKVLPLVYDDSLSYYELLCKVVDYLNKTMEDVEVLEGDVTALHEAYKKLQQYVNDYFKTLDVQKEINNKLDVMAKDGSLTILIKKYVDPFIESQNKKIGVLEERMNTFTKLHDGNTTADAELIDIRVPASGFNGGKAYQTAGEAVRGQIESLNQDIAYQHKIATRLITTPKYQIISDFIEFNEGTYIITFAFNNLKNRVVALKLRNGSWIKQSDTFNAYSYTFEITFKTPFEAFILVQNMDDNIATTDIQEINLYIKNVTNKIIDFSSHINNQLKNPLMENYTVKTVENGYYNKNNSFVSDNEYRCKKTDIIKIETGDKFLYKGVGKYNAISVIWLNDINGTIIDSETHESGSTYKLITPPTDAKYVQFFSFSHKIYDTKLSVMKYYDINSTTGDIDRIRLVENANVLYNKTWVVCGDSWTEGDFTGLPKEQYFDENYGVNKTYQYFIGKRNSMNIITNAISGSTMAITKEYLNGTQSNINFKNPFSHLRYKNIPGIETADYITLMFGINDKYHSNIGTINNVTNDTFYGAWNMVLEYYIKNYSNSKIGIIIYSGDISTDIHKALISVAKNNGIPYLDLNSVEYPLIVNQCEDYAGAKQSIINFRNSQGFVSSSNNHPNVKSQEKFSYIIEEWLKSI